jgi:hypothetical protein
MKTDGMIGKDPKQSIMEIIFTLPTHIPLQLPKRTWLFAVTGLKNVLGNIRHAL